MAVALNTFVNPITVLQMCRFLTRL